MTTLITAAKETNQYAVLSVWLEDFSPLRGTNSKTTHNLLSYFLRLNTLKSNSEAPAVDLLRLNTVRGIKTAILAPKRYDEHPRRLYKGVFSGLPPRFCVIKMVVSFNVWGGAVASWLVRSSPDRAVRVRALAGDIVLCSWARHFTLTVPLSTQVYKWVPG